MVRFDAYSATAIGPKHAELASLLFGGPGDKVRQSRGHHNFGERLAVVDETGDEVGSVMWGGGHGSRVMFEVKGERTPEVVDRFRQAWPEHRCSRVDSCNDFEGRKEFGRLLGVVLDVKKKHGLYGDRGGDWSMPELGRTQYLGARSSAIRVRLYEKGKQPEYRHLERPDWCRLEVQVRPQKEAKTAYSRLGAAEVWGASPFTRDLASRLLKLTAGEYPAGGGRRLPNAERAWRWMCAQYGAAILGKLAEVEGDFEALGVALVDEVRRQESLTRARRGLRERG